MTEAQTTMEEVGPRLKFEDNAIQLDVDWIEQDWIPTWKRVKTAFQKGIKQMTIETYQSKDELFTCRKRHLSCQNWNRWWKRDLERQPED